MDYAEQLRKLYEFRSRIQNNYDGLLSDARNFPQTVNNTFFSPTDGLLSDGMRQRLAQKLASPPQPNHDMWIDRGLRIAAIAPIWKTVEETDPQSLANLLKNYGANK